ncbi:hypothetical protein [Lottiidibacillus patelloidae]|nr:hypothetical protein [Lottiidibacillus patelloidae]
MKKLFGILIVCLSLLFGAILLQLSEIPNSGESYLSVVLLVFVFVIGAILIYDKNEESSLVSNEEIEKELEEHLNK